ncbi:MAG: hypothetical protein HQL45_16490 [Alphaproteobacteria bacterium]|nr:hypothetical protein [Alphaproteobacteria bacterium]
MSIISPLDDFKDANRLRQILTEIEKTAIEAHHKIAQESAYCRGRIALLQAVVSALCATALKRPSVDDVLPYLDRFTEGLSASDQNFFRTEIVRILGESS